MAALKHGQARTGTDNWSLFIRQRRLKDRLRRLRNDFKDCHCPSGCRGGPRDYVAGDAAPSPPHDLHGPYVPVDGNMPRTSRPEMRKHGRCRVLAEARGTSDILLYRDRTRATLRMSLQVHTDADEQGRLGYYGEMFLTQPGRQEQFIGFIHSWHIDRTTKDWEPLYLNRADLDDTDFGFMRVFIRESYGFRTMDDWGHDRNGNVLPAASVRGHFGAIWAGLTDDTDIIYIPKIWVHQNVSGNRIIDQGFELFYRLMVGGTLPARYNITRPLTVLLQPVEIGQPYDYMWRDPATRLAQDSAAVAEVLSRTFSRNGFIRLWGGPPDDRSKMMGRRVETLDHPAALTDLAITPPNPPATYKEIQNLEDWGYAVYDDDSDKDMQNIILRDTYPDVEYSQHQAIRIFVPSLSQVVVDEFIYFDHGTTAGTTLAITQAWNRDNDNRPRHEKLPLRDIILAFWILHLGRAAQDLDAIIYYVVIEKKLEDDLFQAVYGFMGEDMLTNLTLNREAESLVEEEAFNLLLEEAPFCIGVSKMLEEFEEFSGVGIKSFEFFPIDPEDPEKENKPPFHFRIKFYKVGDE